MVRVGPAGTRRHLISSREDGIDLPGLCERKVLGALSSWMVNDRSIR